MNNRYCYDELKKNRQFPFPSDMKKKKMNSWETTPEEHFTGYSSYSNRIFNYCTA